MDKDSIAARVVEEHEKLGGIIEELLETADQSPTVERQAWLDRLRESFFRFRAHLIHRIALEEVGGFYARVLEQRPTLSGDIEHLQRENRDILASIEQVHQILGDTQPDDRDQLELIRLRIHHVSSAVRHHAEHENLLIDFVNDRGAGKGT